MSVNRNLLITFPSISDVELHNGGWHSVTSDGGEARRGRGSERPFIAPCSPTHTQYYHTSARLHHSDFRYDVTLSQPITAQIHSSLTPEGKFVARDETAVDERTPRQQQWSRSQTSAALRNSKFICSKKFIQVLIVQN